MRLTAFFASLLTGAIAAFSQAPNGSFMFGFTNTPLWDFSGWYTNTFPGDVVTLQVVHYANGKVIGTRTEAAVGDVVNMSGTASIRGRTFWTPTSTGVIALPWKGAFTGTMNGALIVGDVTGHGRYTLIPSLLALQAEEVARMRVVGGHCITRNLDQMALPRGMDGTWVLAINVQADGNKLAGAADVRLSNGLILSYAIKGSYNPRQETSVLRLVGSGETQGSSLVIKVEGPSMQLTSLTGSVLGQKLKIRE